MVRRLLGFGLFVSAMATVVLFPRDSDVLAQNKNKNDNDRDEQILRKQVQNLQGDLKQASNIIDNLRREIREREQAINQLQAALKKERNDGDDKALAQARKDLSAAQAIIAQKDQIILGLKKSDAKEDATALRTIDDLRKQIAAAQTAIQQKDQIIIGLKKSDAKDDVAALRTIDDLRRQLKDHELIRKAPLVHTVILKVKKDAPPATTAALLADIPAVLGKIPTVLGYWYGVRAEDASPDFAVKDFQISLVMLFENTDGLKRYLTHPLHVTFVEKYLRFLETPMVYDSLRP